MNAPPWLKTNFKFGNFSNTPPKIRKQYQYYTKANIKKLRDSGYKKSFFTLEEGIKDYIREYLRK